MTLKVLNVILSIAVVSALFAGSPTKSPVDEVFSHLSQAFQKHVKNGLVDYPAIAKDADFKAFVKWLETAVPETLPDKNTKMAFWVNAYNALAIQNVINNSLSGNEWVKSVLDVDGFFNSQKHKAASRMITLDQLEKELAFPQFKDARLHFAFVCAAMSCPLLPSIAYTSENIDSLMTEVAQEFLQNPEKNRLDKEKKILHLSQIFNWYRPDFEKDDKTLVDYLLPYFDETTQAFLRENKVEIKFLEYDWQLNGKQ